MGRWPSLKQVVAISLLGSTVSRRSCQPVASRFSSAELIKGGKGRARARAASRSRVTVVAATTAIAAQHARDSPQSVRRLRRNTQWHCEPIRSACRTNGLVRRTRPRGHRAILAMSSQAEEERPTSILNLPAESTVNAAANVCCPLRFWARERLDSLGVSCFVHPWMAQRRAYCLAANPELSF